MPTTAAYAAAHAGAPLAPFSVSRREPRAGDVAIAISHCGICHTDLHFVNDDFGMSIYPIVPGHEIVGIVTAVGQDVTAFKAGDAVAVGCLVDSCRECRSCRQGREQYCENGFVLTYSSLEKDGITVTQGGYSKHIVVEQRFVLRLSADVSLERTAPLLCAGITTYSPLRRFGVGPGTRLGVIGLGGLGHLGVKLAASMGAEVTVLSTSANKRADASRLGANDFVLTSDAADIARVAGHFDVILDTVAASHDYVPYTNLLRACGTLVCLGVPPEPIQMPAANLIWTGRCIAGSLIGGLPETQEMLDYCAAHDISADVEVIAVDRINDAYERMLRNDVRYRFVVDLSTLPDA